MSAPLLFFGWGNPSRGDDALGPLLCDRLEAWLADTPAMTGRYEVLQDFQLQVEDAADLVGRTLVIFIDASLDAPAPFALAPVVGAADGSVSTHALSPRAVVDVACKIFGAMPLCYQMAVRGESFGLGEELSASARFNLEAAWQALRQIAEAPAAIDAARALSADQR